MRTPTPKTPTPMAGLLLALALMGMLALAGCVNPNSNLSYSTCCAQSATPYTCTVASTDANGMQTLGADCGVCAYRDVNGTTYNSNHQVIESGKCSNNCNFVHSDCSGADNKSTCYLINNSGVTSTAVAPICANATPNACIQSQCSARMCGEPVPNPKGRMDGDSTTQVTDSSSGVQNSYMELAKTDQPTGLVSKICTYQKMDQRANRLLNAKDWFVDSLRLGVGGTFSDYDRARYYLPPSDFYCSRTSPNAVVDRFTAYLNGSQKLAIFDTSYKAAMSICKAELDGAGTITDYYCAINTSLNFSVATLGSAEAARVACDNACSANRFRACTQNSELLTENLSVSPSSVKPVIYWPFTDIDAYAARLAAAYPTPAPNANTPAAQDPRNYYKPLLPTSDPNFTKNQALPGPAGAKVFECAADGDCLSGDCDTTNYLRGSCFRNDGTPVDCGCHYVTNCQSEYMCEGMQADSIPRWICNSNRDQCRAGFGGQDKQDGKVQVVCDYQPTAFDVFADSNGLTGGNDGSGSYCSDDWAFGVTYLYKFPCYGDRNMPSIEFANKQILLKGGQYCEVNGESRPYNCANGRSRETNCQSVSGHEKDIWIGDNCGGDDCGWEDKPVRTGSDFQPACSEGTPKKSASMSGWTDLGLDYTTWRWNANSVLYTVPDRPVVSSPSAQPGGQGILLTSKSVHYCDNDPKRSLSGLSGTCTETVYGETCNCGGPIANLNWSDVKFKLIQACNLKFGTLTAGGAYSPSDADIVLVSPSNNSVGWQTPGSYWTGTSSQTDIDWAYREKTWLIRSFGDCQNDSSGAPTLVGYGVCKPCSTMLTLASQKVSGAPAACPSGCGTSYSYDGQALCDCTDSKYQLPNKKFPASAGSTTSPDFGFIAGKVDEYQRSNIMPLLDLRNYSVSAPTVPNFELLWGNCEDYGAISDGTSGGIFGATTCKASAYPNFLLGFLAANHSATILDVADLPLSTEEPNATREQVAQAKLSCPDCLVALEYNQTLKMSEIAAAVDHYPADLQARIQSYSGGVAFDLNRTTAPDWPEEEGRLATTKVSMLIIDVDLSDASSDAGVLEGQIDGLISLSRRSLQHVGWPTMLRLTYTRGSAGALADQAVYKALYAKQAELTLAGVGGILLPPLDNAEPETVGSAYADEGNAGRLLDASGNRAKVNTAGTAFCAAQNGSTEYLHPNILVGLQKLYTKTSCSCIACTAIEIATGQCDRLCYDGTAGHNRDGSECRQNEQKCEAYCVNDAALQVVNSSAWADKTTTCTALRSTNTAPVACCSATRVTDCKPWPDCDIQPDIRLAELADDTLHPDANYLLAGLPHKNNVFGLMSNGTGYTYRASTSVSMTAEPVFFPKYGSNESDCGRTDVPGIDESQVSCGTPLPPVLDTLWTCSEPK